MSQYGTRKTEIIKMRTDGDNYRKIAEKFNLSRTRVQQILKKNEMEMNREKRAENLRREIGMLDNITKKYAREEIFDCLLLNASVVRILNDYLADIGIAEISLKDLIDNLIIAKNIETTNLYEAMPVFRLRRVGCKTYISTVNQITKCCNFCSFFEREWRIRKDRLKEHLKNTHTYLCNGIL